MVRNIKLQSEQVMISTSHQLEDADGDGYANYLDTDYDPCIRWCWTFSCRPAETPWIMSQKISGRTI